MKKVILNILLTLTFVQGFNFVEYDNSIIELEERIDVNSDYGYILAVNRDKLKIRLLELELVVNDISTNSYTNMDKDEQQRIRLATEMYDVEQMFKIITDNSTDNSKTRADASDIIDEIHILALEIQDKINYHPDYIDGEIVRGNDAECSKMHMFSRKCTTVEYERYLKNKSIVLSDSMVTIGR